MDSIFVYRINCPTRIGVGDEERSSEQTVWVSVELFVDTTDTADTDDVTKSIDYAKVTETVTSLAQTERKTLERFAEDIARTLLSTYHPTRVKVSIEKKPADLPNIEHVLVTIERP